MIIKRCSSKEPELLTLIQQLDAELAERDGEEHAFYAQYNGLDEIAHLLLLYVDKKAFACGALKKYDEFSMEIKRMFVVPEMRGKGLASALLQALEEWALELGAESCILETGIKQPEAIRLYEKNGYQRIPNYGQYSGVEDSFCFKKDLNSL